jgi:hypothetical protein
VIDAETEASRREDQLELTGVGWHANSSAPRGLSRRRTIQLNNLADLV